jgi:hypothetical protein
LLMKQKLKKHKMGGGLKSFSFLVVYIKYEKRRTMVLLFLTNVIDF